jgi:hypothetical protein
MNSNFKTDRLALLQSLADYLDDGLAYSEVNVRLERDVSELLIDLTDKQKIRRLKKLRKELEKWIVEAKKFRASI